MSQKTIFHLARHGQTQWNIEHRIQGQIDSDLTLKGQQQALQLATYCLPFNISKILCSPLGRAIQTADICAKKLQLSHVILKGIEERHFGLWQGRLSPEMQSHVDYVDITSQVTDCKPEQGESAKALLFRFHKALKQQFQKAPDDNYLIITHGDVLRCFMSQFLQENQSNTGYDYKNGHSIAVSYDHISGHFSLL